MSGGSLQLREYPAETVRTPPNRFSADPIGTGYGKS